MKKKDFDVIKEISLPKRHLLSDGYVRLVISKEDGKNLIERKVKRNNVRNIVDKYELIKKDGQIELLPLDNLIGLKILDRIEKTDLSYNACFVFHEGDEDGPILGNPEQGLDWVKSVEEHKYTSTGIKFWRHSEQMFEYLKENKQNKKTIISTHISPEGACNLKCPYCSVTYRDTHSRIPLEKIQNYVIDLKSRGLKAVILTGGGEPTLYPDFNKLVQWLKKDQDLSVALITNGTTSKRIEDETMKCFSWVRVSINIFEGWTEKIKLSHEKLDPNCIVGCSMVYTSEHEAIKQDVLNDRISLFNSVSKVADNCGAKYIRLLPNCLLDQDNLIRQHKSLQKTLLGLEDKRYFQQYKVHGAPKSKKCHQSYFRPYLSEEPFGDSGIPGAVYPCDSVVLNDTLTHFAKKYQLCAPEDVISYIDGYIEQKFDANEDCKGCVFTDNVNMLDDWKNGRINNFDAHREPMTHEEFV